MTTEKYQKCVIHGTKKHIIETARKLFSEYSYLGVSMSDIAKKLNITKAALYYHFTGKTEIYKEVLGRTFDSLSSSIAQAFNERTDQKRMHKLIKNYLDFGFKEKNLIKALMLKLSPANPLTKHIRELREQILVLIHPLIKNMFTNKKLTQKIDSHLLTSLLVDMMDGLLLEYSFLDKRIDSKKVSNQIIAVLF